MSLYSLLNHRCHLYSLTSSDNDGSVIYRYAKITSKPIRCRLDLSFIRQSKDATWMAAVARPDDRTGTLFLLPNAPLKSGMRVEMVKGPKGFFEIQGALDEAWAFSDKSHYEVGVSEVSSLQFRKPQTQEPGEGF